MGRRLEDPFPLPSVLPYILRINNDSSCNKFCFLLFYTIIVTSVCVV